jgi:hypothetical protein
LDSTAGSLVRQGSDRFELVWIGLNSVQGKKAKTLSALAKDSASEASAGLAVPADMLGTATGSDDGSGGDSDGSDSIRQG